MGAIVAALAAAGLAAGGCITTIQGGAAADAPRIADVTIAGNHQVKDDDIVKGLANRPPEGFFTEAYRRLDRPALEQDISRIESYYQRRGFFSAKVVGTDIVPAGKGAVKVTFRVVEGPPTRVAGLTLAGLARYLFRSKALELHEAPLRQGSIFRHDRYLAFKAWLSAWLAQRGFPHAEVEGRVDVDREAHTADIRMTVDAGPRARFGQTEIRGLHRVPEDVVRHRLAWQPGERFNTTNIELTQSRLYQLGMFSVVRMDYEKKGRPETTDIGIDLIEARRNELRLGGGVTLDGGFDPQNLRWEFHGRADYVLRGALSPLSTLRVEARPAYTVDRPNSNSYSGLEATATLDRVDLFAPRMVGKVTVGYENDEPEAYKGKGPLVRAALSRPFLHDDLQISLGWRFRYLFLTGVNAALNGVTNDGMDTPNPVEQEESAAIGLDGDIYRLGALEQSISFDRRDQPLDARRGLYAAVTFNEGGAALGGAFPFVRVTGDVRGYLPIGQRLVLAARASYGRRLGRNYLPVTERFFDGGASGHRGFGYRRLSPYVTSEDPPTGTSTEPDVQTVPIGGDQDLLGSGEVRAQVGTIGDFPFGVVGFVDAGDAICDLPTCLPAGRLDLTNLHWAAGLGVRWNWIVSVRGDVGYRLNRYQAGEPDAESDLSPLNRLALHLSVGQAF